MAGRGAGLTSRLGRWRSGGRCGFGRRSVRLPSQIERLPEHAPPSNHLTLGSTPIPCCNPPPRHGSPDPFLVRPVPQAPFRAAPVRAVQGLRLLRAFESVLGFVTLSTVLSKFSSLCVQSAECQRALWVVHRSGCSPLPAGRLVPRKVRPKEAVCKHTKRITKLLSEVANDWMVRKMVH